MVRVYRYILALSPGSTEQSIFTKQWFGSYVRLNNVKGGADTEITSAAGRLEAIGFAVEGRDEAVDAVLPQDSGELGAAGRHFADRAVEIDVRNQPTAAAGPHQVIDLDRLTIGLDDPAVHREAGWSGLLADHLEPLSVITVEALGIDRR